MIKRREGCSRRGGGRDVINSRDGGRRVQRERETISCCLPSETDSACRMNNENKTSTSLSLSLSFDINIFEPFSPILFTNVYIY